MTKHYILQAINSNGKSVFIDDVPNGKKCGCFCLECKSRLIAKQGSIRAHHFAHESGNDNIKCTQTALHLLAKEIILDEKRIPAFINGKIEFVTVDYIEQEKNLNDIKPDLYAKYNGKPIAIEIFVSHAVDNIKFQKIQNHKLTTFEINLSEIIFETREDVKNAIYDLKNIRPIYDVDYTDRAITNKKKFIDINGKIKAIINGNISKCPMNIIMKGLKASLSSVKSSLCEKCPFGYRLDTEDVVHCIGHLNIELSKKIFLSKVLHQKITVNLDYGCQINVSKNKIVSLSEMAEYFTCITGIKFTENKQSSKRFM